MYATAQRVRSDRTIGINTLIYRHEPTLAIQELQSDQVVQQSPGNLVSARITLPPGGNTVLSYFDVIAPETVAHPDVAERLLHLKAAALGGGWVQSGQLRVRFERLAGHSANPSREYDELSAPLIDLLRAPTPLPWAEGHGVTIRCFVHNEDAVFQLEPASESVLRPTRSPEWRPPTVSVGHVTMDDLKMSGVDTWVEIAKVVTGASPEELLAFGPVRFVTADGRGLWSWPAVEGVGYCLQCHRQHTLTAEARGYRCSNCSSFQTGDGRFVSVVT